MEKEIMDHLRQFEEDRQARILFACESGSGIYREGAGAVNSNYQQAVNNTCKYPF
jgi:hypothetical protein